MSREGYLLAVADAIQLHDQRVREAHSRIDRLRYELDQAEKHRAAVEEARDQFKAAIKNHEDKNR